MQQRISYQELQQLHPSLTASLLSLGEASAENLDPTLIHLLKIRVSQLNGCAFCQHMHANEARQDNEQQSRLDVLPAWRETLCFSKQERAALNWAEVLTDLSSHSEIETAYQQLLEQFSQDQLVKLTGIILTINSWNRVAIGFQFVPEIPAKD